MDFGMIIQSKVQELASSSDLYNIQEGSIDDSSIQKNTIENTKKMNNSQELDSPIKKKPA